MAPVKTAMLFAVALAATCAAAQAAEQRIALVVGNSAYPSARLKNPVNDATAIAAKLRALGFEVTLKNEASQRELTRAISQFGQGIKLGSVALFYYAGHGMQVRGRNFLIPIDAEIENEASARSEGVDLDLLLEQLGPARLSMVILDACRNNPFESRIRASRGSGLAQVDAPKGVLLAYATAPGKVASDGEGANGLYTAELLKALDLPGLKVEEVFKAVRVNVTRATANEQIPWESSSLTGDFYFRPVDTREIEDKKARDAERKQTELQKTVESEKMKRDQETEAIRHEMEKLRAEIRALRDAPVAVAKAEPVAEAPRKVTAAEPPKKLALAAPPKEMPKAQPAHQHGRSMALLQASRGQMTFSKGMALLLEIENAEDLDRLIAAERLMKRMPYNSAFAMGVNSAGFIHWGRAWRSGIRSFAETEALDNCKQHGDGVCKVVMLNGDFQEDAFMEIAAAFPKRNPEGPRKRFIARLPTQ